MSRMQVADDLAESRTASLPSFVRFSLRNFYGYCKVRRSVLFLEIVLQHYDRIGVKALCFGASGSFNRASRDRTFETLRVVARIADLSAPTRNVIVLM